VDQRGGGHLPLFKHNMPKLKNLFPISHYNKNVDRFTLFSENIKKSNENEMKDMDNMEEKN